MDELETPTDLPVSSWWGVVNRVVTEFKNDDASDLAAALSCHLVPGHPATDEPHVELRDPVPSPMKKSQELK
jgi:hypothetical protein